ncbi:hypothetical protein GCM10027562_26880 [Arthrobacter pigmenti]
MFIVSQKSSERLAVPFLLTALPLQHDRRSAMYNTSTCFTNLSNLVGDILFAERLRHLFAALVVPFGRIYPTSENQSRNTSFVAVIVALSFEHLPLGLNPIQFRRVD